MDAKMIDGTTVKEVHRWASMILRCYDSENPNYSRYGGRGIKVCERWHDYRNFREDVGAIAKGLSLDRIDNDGDYCPENIRLATTSEQANNRSQNVRITYKGETKTIAEWAEATGIEQRTLGARLRNPKWTIEEAFTRSTDRRLHLTHNGKTQTLEEWADELGMDKRTIHNRIKEGWTTERALSTPILVETRQITFEGKTQTLTEWSKELGIKRCTLNARLHKGYTVEEAFTTPSRIKRKSFEKFGKALKDFAEEQGVTRSCVHRRIAREKITADMHS